MKTELTLESLRSSVPAIFAEAPAQGVSESYQFVSTLMLINPMLAEGWRIHRAQQQVTTKGLTPTGSHLVVMRHERLPEDKENTVELVINNSHDRTRRLHIACGIFRIICSNGMVAMTAGLASKKMMHLEGVIKVAELMNAVEEIAKQGPVMMNKVEDFRKRILTGEEQRILAEKALKTRYGSYAPTVSTDAVLKPRRELDKGDNLWLTFNRVQENLMKGTIDGKHASKPISSLMEQTRINKELWKAAEAFLN